MKTISFEDWTTRDLGANTLTGGGLTFGDIRLTKIDGKTVFDVLPQEFAKDVAGLIRKGVRIAGGCCGTTPEYIAALTAQTENLAPLPIVPKDFTCVSS